MNYARNYFHTNNTQFLESSGYTSDNFQSTYFKALQDSLKQSDQEKVFELELGISQLLGYNNVLHLLVQRAYCDLTANCASVSREL